ncbi:restriction endonuclease subunit S, partial [Bacteroides caecimuris]|uniref:restriction endonuclease subunit S n=1 Tax=Bacteroides caecimuris TaxID=1796613 RepID=UPI002573DC0C
AKDKDLKTPNVPPLRFPGFSDEWVKVSLGDIGETLIGLTYSPKDVVANDGTIVFRSSNIQDGMIDYTDLVRVNKPIKERIVTRENDILICARNGSQRLIGKNALLTKADEGNTFGAFMMIYRSDDNDVIHPILSTRRYISQVSENLGARINQITTSDLNSFEFYIPSNCIERRKIGKLFALINERIATQNKIIDNLQSLIKGLRERIFAPMLSNLIKLGAIANITNGSGDVQDAISKYADDLYPFFDRSEDMKYFSSFGFDAEAIIYAGEGSEFLPRYYNGKFALHQRCYAITNFNKDYIPRFVYHFLSTQNNYFIRKAVGSTVPSLRMDTFQNIGIPIVDKTLQSYVSNRLDTSCRLYDYEKQILSLYRNQKDYLLQNLFI